MARVGRVLFAAPADVVVQQSGESVPIERVQCVAQTRGGRLDLSIGLTLSHQPTGWNAGRRQSTSATRRLRSGAHRSDCQNPETDRRSLIDAALTWPYVGARQAMNGVHDM